METISETNKMHRQDSTLVMNKNILGNWITKPGGAPYYARKEFDIHKNIISAKAYVCGLGQFVFYINETKVSDHELDPGWTNYRQYIEYVTFDITEHLHQGSNALGVEVSNGWYIKTEEGYTFTFPQFMPPNPNPYMPFGKNLPLAVKIVVTYEDHTEECIYGDESFKVHKHPVISSNVYGSETFEGSLEQPGWTKVGFEDFLWENASVIPKEEQPKGRLVNQFQPAIKVIKTYPAAYLHQVGGREIYDLSQNISGLLHMQIKGKPGDVIKVYPAEKLKKDGNVDQMAKNWVEVNTCITIVIGSENKWNDYRMKFTYFAGRYLAVEKSSEDIEIKNLAGDAITSAWKTDGSFICDDARYEKIYDMIERSVEANMLSVHTDCPTIERFAWQEVNHLMAPSIMYMKDSKKLWEKFLLDMRVEQHGKDTSFYNYQGEKIDLGEGLIPSQCPCYIPNVLPVPGMGSFYDITPWGSASILGTRWHFIFYGDKTIIEDNYETGKRYLNHLKSKVNEDGFLNHGLGDWGNPNQEYARENVETAFLYADTVSMEYFAQVLGLKEDEEMFHTYAQKVMENYNEKLLVRREDGRWCYRNYEYKDDLSFTQACEALPLYWDMVPKEKLADVVEVFRESLIEKQGFSSGEVGLPYVIQTARRYHMNDFICDYITKEEHPSYYAFVKDGMTTLGEYWEENPRSHCHDMMGHIMEWYYNGMAGIQPIEPGFKKILIQPYLPESMHYMECKYASVQGIIQVKMHRVSGNVKLEVEVPEGVSYRVDRSNL